VADRRHPDGLASGDQRADHSGAGICLAGTAALNRENPFLHRECHSPARVERRFSRQLDRPAPDPRRAPNQKVPCGRIWTITFDAVSGYVLADPQQRLCEDAGAEHHVREDGLGMIRVGIAAHDVDPPLLDGDFPDRSEFAAADRVELFPTAELRFLRREAVAMDGGLGRAAPLRHEFQAGKRRALVEQVIGGQLGQPVKLPPDRLVLAPVPV